jgi:hypothetical protein
MQLFEPCILDEMNEELCKDFSSDEIADDLFQIGPLKEPRPDGFRARSFQRNWGVMKQEVIKGVQKFLQPGRCLQYLFQKRMVWSY